MMMNMVMVMMLMMVVVLVVMMMVMILLGMMCIGIDSDAQRLAHCCAIFLFYLGGEI